MYLQKVKKWKMLTVSNFLMFCLPEISGFIDLFLLADEQVILITAVFDWISQPNLRHT